jgi:methylmalonyl-CoA mutase
MAPDARQLRRTLRDVLDGRQPPAAELERLRQVAAAGPHDGSAIDAAVEALAAGATISEATGALRGDGTATGCEPLPQQRDGEIFERLRAAGDAWLAESGRRPRAYLAAVGPPAEHRPIREFVANLLAVAGIGAVEAEGDDDWDAVISGFESSGTRTAVIAVHPKHAEEAVPELARALKERGALWVLVAAPPGESEGDWRAAGVDGFLCEGCDVHQALQGLLAAAGWLP